MLGKVLTVLIAFIAGAGALYGYQYVSGNLVQPPVENEDPRILEIEKQLAAMTERIGKLSESQQAAATDSDTLAARLNTLDERFSGLQKKQGELALAGSSTQPGTQVLKEGPGQRLSGEQLARALKELPEEGRKLIRDAIYEEIQRVKKDGQPDIPSKEELEKKAAAGIQHLTGILSLTPIQVEQIKDIAARQIERLIETARVAKERDDPAYAESAKKEIQADVEREVIEMLTPEQLDKLRERDPEGFGRRHPRGF